MTGVRNTTYMLMAVLLLATSVRARSSGVKGQTYAVRKTNKAGGVKGTQQRQLSGEPDVDNMDLSLFRAHEEGFPGGLFFEDSEGEAKLQEMMPQWRNTGNGNNRGSDSWTTKKSCKSWKGGKGGKGGKGSSTKAPSVGKGKGKGAVYCSEAPSMVPTNQPSFRPSRSPSISAKGASLSSSKGTGSGGTGSEKETTPQLFDAGAECESIYNDPNVYDGGVPYTVSKSYTFDANFKIKSTGDVDVENILDKYVKYTRLYVLGCFEEAGLELAKLDGTRKLLIEPLFQATMREWNEGKCSKASKGSKDSGNKDCDYINVVKTYWENYGDDPSKEAIKDRVKDALDAVIVKLLSEDGIESVSIGKVKVSKAISGKNDAGAAKAGSVIGATAGALALLMLLMFLVKRNRDDDEVSHLKFEDDDETFVREFESEGSEKGRRAHIIGESDSVMSGWTGYSMEDDYSRASADSGKLGHAKGDVHMCSSATCEVCERRRQQGVTFIKTSTPPTPTRPECIPIDATREYVAEDVVVL